MKQIYTLLTFLLTTTLFAQDLVMTVSVPPGTTECRFSGAFWNFDPFGGPVGVDNGNDTFTFTLSPAPTADMEYIYTINGTGVYEVIWDNAANAECTARIDNGNMITDYFSYGNRIWKTTDNLTWNEIYDDCSEATSCNPAAPGFTCIPDVNFETRLIELGIDNSDPSDLVDGLLDNAQAASVTGDLVLNNKGIVDFTGIEAFTGIAGLNIDDNIITDIDLTSNTLLVSLSMVRCKADNINLTGLTQLRILNLRECDLSAIDLSTNTVLEILDVYKNELTVLDLSNNLSLTSVDCQRQTDDPADSSPFNTLINIDLNGSDRSILSSFNANFNYSSECIYVNDPSAPYVGWTIDGTFPADYCTGTLGTEDREISAFSMYPNPVRNYVMITSKTQSSILDVYSIAGKLVLTKELSFGDNSVNVSALSSGIYITRFTSDNRSETKKLVIN